MPGRRDLTNPRPERMIKARAFLLNAKGPMLMHWCGILGSDPEMVAAFARRQLCQRGLSDETKGTNPS
jgi:hypothetical protein